LGTGSGILTASNRSGGGFSSDRRAEFLQADFLHIHSAAAGGCFRFVRIAHGVVG
jgi:hypothetical protein